MVVADEPGWGADGPIETWRAVIGRWAGCGLATESTESVWGGMSVGGVGGVGWSGMVERWRGGVEW